MFLIWNSGPDDFSEIYKLLKEDDQHTLFETLLKTGELETFVTRYENFLEIYSLLKEADQHTLFEAMLKTEAFELLVTITSSDDLDLFYASLEFAKSLNPIDKLTLLELFVKNGKLDADDPSLLRARTKVHNQANPMTQDDNLQNYVLVQYYNFGDSEALNNATHCVDPSPTVPLPTPACLPQKLYSLR